VPILELGNRRLHFEDEGDGDPIILLHPVGLNSDWWKPLAQILHDRYRVIRPDARGHGKSADIAGAITLADFVDDIDAILATLNVGPAVVIGLSFGGMLAQYVALDLPSRVAGLILAGTSPAVAADRRQTLIDRGRKAMEQGMAPLVEDTIQRWFSPAGQQSPLAETCRALLRSTRPANWNATWQAMAEFDALPRLGEIRVPTLVVSGEIDLSSPPAAGAVIARNIPGANQTIIPGGAHFFPFEHAALFEPVVLEFLDRVTA
jgi:3-oxoadipate enol-lactonase